MMCNCFIYVCTYLCSDVYIQSFMASLVDEMYNESLMAGNSTISIVNYITDIMEISFCTFSGNDGESNCV